MVRTELITIDSEGNNYSCNLTGEVKKLVAQSEITDGMVFVFFQHTTGAVLIIEHEAGFIVDMEDMLERIMPSSIELKHHMRGYDQNGRAHVLTGLLNTTASVPFNNGELMLGTYQDIYFIDMQPEPRERNVVVQIVGE